MGTMLLKTEPATDTFLLNQLVELNRLGKVALKEGRIGVVRYYIKNAMEKEKGGN
jgi:hypothetical protein